MPDLGLDELSELLDEPQSTVKNRAPIPQYGVLRLVDTEMRCACRGCSSPTYYKVSGVPRCMTHALKELNYMLLQAYPVSPEYQ